ncbi:peptidoglycan recognition protein family protein [Chryseobacterium balustinum]|uniref:peptidoglycan recognition protein family protein n=1 Tax=Chryseobacterium balustinum TaxID=246 RepID=UPI003CF9B28E
MEKLRARAYCVNMLKKELVLTLWEDDAKGEGHNANNKLIETRKAKVNENGIAVTEFMLTKALMKKAMQGETDPKQLEFYVTVEYYSHKKHATDNVNINNPFPPIKHEVPVKPRGVPKAPGSPAASKPPSKKEERGIGQIISEKWDELWDWWETPGTIKKDQSPTVQKPDGRSPAIVKGEKPKENNETCVCKQYDLIWGGHPNVSCEFRKKVIEIAKDLWPNNWLEMANNLMAVFAWETGETFKSDVPNQKKSGATGLIQFMPERADEYFGKHTIEIVPNYFNSNNKKLHYLPRVKEFAQMSALDQLEYVKKYFTNLKGKKLDFVDFYLQVLFPVSSGKPEHYVFGTENNKHLIGLSTDTPAVRQKRVDKYEGNSGMDKLKDGKISKSEIASYVNKYKSDGNKYKKITECKNEKSQKKSETGGCFENIVKDGFLIDSKVEVLKKGTTPKINKDVKIIVLHRTHYNLKHDVKNLIINNKYPVHFWVNADGKIYQQTSLEHVSYHIGVAQKAHTIANKWGNNNSISIEVNGEYLDKNGKRANNEVAGGYWEAVTNDQAQSVACLVSFLMDHFSLSKSDIKVHEELCAKTKGEGKTVYDAMLPLLK